ncbi:hypothetical protein, partial [uncultured Desulfovibrio sp.]
VQAAGLPITAWHKKSSSQPASLRRTRMLFFPGKLFNIFTVLCLSVTKLPAAFFSLARHSSSPYYIHYPVQAVLYSPMPTYRIRKILNIKIF